MFAVKGWNLDAALLKPQTEVFTKTSSSVLERGQEDAKSSTKRKRDRHEQDGQPKATPAVEPTTENTRANKKQKKKRKIDIDPAPVTTRPAQDDTTTAQSSKSSKKVKPVQPQDDAPSKNGNTKAVVPVQTPGPKVPAASKLTPLQAAMRQKLVSARFRHLNETLYTAPSKQALELFAANPDMFEDYHAGFRQQVAVWPENPVDKMIQKIRQRGSVRLQSQKKAFKSKGGKSAPEPVQSFSVSPLPRTHGSCTIADCGCGDARLAQTLKSSNELQKLNVKVLSYDLHSPSSLVTKADISNLPVADGTVDVALFCLALMGTNWISFIEEAYRILHWKGELWIAEIKSRFARVGKHGKVVEHSVGNRKKRAATAKAQETKRKEQEETLQDEVLQKEVDGVEKIEQETDVKAFIEVLRRRGFVLKDEQTSIDLDNKMFVSMEFIKAAAPVKGKGYVEPPVSNDRFKKFKSNAPAEDEVPTDDEAKTLKPCLYKIR